MAKTLTDKQGDDPRGGITGRDGYIMSLALLKQSSESRTQRTGRSAIKWT